MVTSYAIIIDNKVVNRIVADPAFIVDYCNEIGASFSTFEGAVVGARREDGEWVMPRVVPSSVRKPQAVLALDAMGLLDDVEAYMETAPRQQQLAWKHAQILERQGATVLTVAQALGWDDELLDTLFITGGEIVL